MLHLTKEDLDWFFRPTFDYKVQRYPLTDLLIDKETDDIIIRVACSGFSKDEIELEQKGNQLHIRGEKKVQEDGSKFNYVQRHISDNSFERVIVLHENYVSGKVNASLENGILTVTVVPQEQKKNLISIE